MKTTVQTSRGPVRFHSVGEPIAGIPAKPATHTSGPWTYREVASADAYYFAVRNGEDGTFVAEVGLAATKGQLRKQEANARLIAAAPDLFSALKGMLEVFADELDCEDMETVKAARAAIARARQA